MNNKTIKSILIITGCFFISFCYAQNWDINLLENINPQHPNSFVWKTATNTTYPVSVSIPVGMFVYSKISKDKNTEEKSYELAGSIVIAGIATEGTKIIFNRQRPYEKYNTIYSNSAETGKSFPSAHAAIAFATATSLSLEYKKWYVVVPAYVWAAGVGYSRLYLGEHYPTDVLAGAVIGAGSAVISYWIIKKVFK